MKNPTRRFSGSEYELLMDALRGHDFLLTHTPVTALFDKHFAPLLGPDSANAAREFVTQKFAASAALRRRLADLYHHDIPLDSDLVPDDQKTYCLGCRRRHVPHCAACPGCLPEELPE